MQSKDVRNTFLEFFESKGHQRIPSSSLIPSDQSVLLTIAGMLQFKPIFLGLQKPAYPKATTCQKCVRANDIDRVGHTTRHQTFFEMLGNFSFGDYFKEQAVAFAWELLTEKFNIPKEKLWAAIFQDDEEAYQIWKSKIGLPENKIVRLDEENNFWSAGTTGPCGPCSEIYYDFGEDKACGPECKPGCDCERFLEIWNLVFIEYNRNEAGELDPLPAKNIDTGMGLERICRVLQGVGSNFETDLFVPIINRINDVSVNDIPVSKRIIADHSRAVTYMIADGITPFHEERGYVLKRLIRHAIMHGKKLGFTAQYLWDFCDIVITLGKDFYPELAEQRNFIKSIVQAEEKSFEAVYKSGLEMIDALLARTKGKYISGSEIFKLHDTYGFPYDLTKEILEDKGYTFDEAGFHKKMEQQKELSRTAAVKEDFQNFKKELLDQFGATQFLGYKEFKVKSKVAGVNLDQNYLILEKTPFYPESGGQVGDTGTIADVLVTNTVGDIGGIILHKMEDASGFKAGEEVEAKRDDVRHAAITIHHTATHLLHAALREVLGGDVRQAGSYVGPDRLRFDFTYREALNQKQIKEVETIINRNIMKAIDLNIYQAGFEEAKAKGVTALFEQKYGDQVRVVEIPGASQELCGGCHVKNTADIEILKILKEEALQSGVRRIEAAGGQAVWFYLSERYNALTAKLSELSKKVGKFIEPKREEVELRRLLVAKNLDMIADLYRDLEEQIEEVTQQVKVKEKFHAEELTRAAASLRSEALENVKEIKGIKVLSYQASDFDVKSLRVLGDSIENVFTSGIVLLASKHDNRVYFHVRVSEDLIQKGYHAGDLVRVMAQTAGGMGGGRPDKADAGARDPFRIGAAFEKVLEMI